MDRLAPAADLSSGRGAGKDGGPNGTGVLGARVVVRDHDVVGEAGGDLAHQRALAGVAVAAAAEHDQEPPSRVRPQRLQRLGQGLGLVGVVDERRGSGRMAGHQLHPAGRRMQVRQKRHQRVDRGSAGQHQSRCRQQVAGLEATDESDGKAVAAAQELDLERHAVGRGRAADEPQRLRPLAIVDDPQLPVDREPGQIGELGDVGVEHRGGAGGQQLGEQPALGGIVGGRAAVIVEVIAAEIGEGGSGQPYAVDTALVEPVAGGLERQMLDTFGREPGRHAVQRDRVRRGQAAVAGCVGGLQAQRAEAGGGQLQTGPELAGEHRDRALAAGAGHRHHRRWLAAVEARGDPGQGCARLLGHQCRQIGGGDHAGIAQDRHRTRGTCVGQEAPAIGPRARHRREQVARTHGARNRGLGRRSRPRRCPAGAAGHRTALPGARLASRR